ncbi:MAG: hypothetical protein AAFU85_19050 [Planctomycetota bacterium]
MMHRKPFFFAAAALIAIVGVTLGVATPLLNAQQVGIAGAPEPVVMGYPLDARTSVFGRLTTSRKQQNQVAKLVQTLKANDVSETDRSAAKDQLTDVLAAQFDEDLKARENRIAQLEDQLKSLREQIGKRRDAKNRLIDLRIELLLNEADGLGFPKAWNQSMTNRFSYPTAVWADSEFFSGPAAPDAPAAVSPPAAATTIPRPALAPSTPGTRTRGR